MLFQSMIMTKYIELKCDRKTFQGPQVNHHISKGPHIDNVTNASHNNVRPKNQEVKPSTNGTNLLTFHCQYCLYKSHIREEIIMRSTKVHSSAREKDETNKGDFDDGQKFKIFQDPPKKSNDIAITKCTTKDTSESCKQDSGKEDDIKTSNFDCNICGLRVITKEDLVQHLDIKHSTKKFFGDATIKAENNNSEIKLNKRSKKKNQCPVVRNVNI